MPTYRADYADSGQKDALGVVVLQPVASLLSNEIRVGCPKCGSPYVATFGLLDSRARTLASFTCTAGDCRYAGSVGR